MLLLKAKTSKLTCLRPCQTLTIITTTTTTPVTNTPTPPETERQK